MSFLDKVKRFLGFRKDEYDYRVGDYIWFRPESGQYKSLGLDGRITAIDGQMITVTLFMIDGKRHWITIPKNETYGRVHWKARVALGMNH